MAGGITGYGLTNLLTLETETKINAEFYQEHITKGIYPPAFKKVSGPGKFDNFEYAIFMQDGAPSHTANATQNLCSQLFLSFWAKDFWLGNSPGLNPTENVSSVMEGKVNCPPLATNKGRLVRKKSRTPRSTLDYAVTLFFRIFKKARRVGRNATGSSQSTRKGKVHEKCT